MFGSLVGGPLCRRMLVSLVSVAVVAAVLQVGTGVAEADDTITIPVGSLVGPPVTIVPPIVTGTASTTGPDVINVESPGFCAANPGRCDVVIGGPTMGPYDAHSEFYQATDAQRAALVSLQESAIQSILTVHGLPGSDHDAVLAWDRSEIRAVMWEEITQALQTATGQRSATQQAVVEYFGVLMQRQSVNSAIAAIREYNKWSGNPSYINLPYADLAADPAGGASRSGSSTTGTGFCQYHPPGPYDTTSEYDGRVNVLCYRPCTTFLGCPFPQPSYDQFVNWGTWDATNARIGTATFAGVAQQAASAIAMGTAVVGSAVIGAAVAAALPGVLDASAFAAAIAPYGGLAAPELFAAGAPAAAADGAFVAANLGGAVGIVVTALVIAILEGIQVVQNAQLPSKLNQLLSTARSAGPGDAASLVGTDSGQRALYSLFLDATTPEHVGGAMPTVGTPETFITKAGRTATLSYTDAAGTTQTVRASGGWFYVTLRDANGNIVSQDQPSLYLLTREPQPGGQPTSRTYWHMMTSDGQPAVLGLRNGQAVMAGDLKNCGTTSTVCSYGPDLVVHTPAEAGPDDTQTVKLVADVLAIQPANTSTKAGTPVQFTATAGGQDVTSAATFLIDGKPCTANSCSATKPGLHTVRVIGPDRQTTVSTSLSVAPGQPGGISMSIDPVDPVATSPFSVSVTLTDAYGNAITNANQDATLTLPGGTCTQQSLTASCTVNQAGDYVLSASYPPNFTTSVHFTAVSAPVASLSIDQFGAVVHAGDQLTFSSHGFDAGGHDLGDVSNDVTYAVDGVPCPQRICTFTRTSDVTPVHVTATLRSISAFSPIVVHAGAPVSVSVNPPAAGATAGTAFPVSWSATDAYGNVTSGTSSAGSLTIDGGTCTATTCTTNLAGIHHLGVQTSSGATVTGAPVYVAPAAPDHIVLGSAPSTVVAGERATYQPRTLDRFGNQTTATGGYVLAMTNGSCAAATCTGYVVGAQTVEVSQGALSTTTPLAVTAGPVTSLTVSSSTATPQAGTAFTLTAHGIDAYGNDAGDRTSAVTFTLPTGTNGTCDGASCTITKAGAATVTATAGSAVGSVDVTVGAAALDHLTLDGPTTVTAGSTATFTVNALDRNDNAISSFTPTLTMTGGTCTGLTCTSTTAGPATVTAAVGTVSVTKAITVRAAAAASMTVTGGGQSAAVTQAFSHPLSATAYDIYGNRVPGTAISFAVAGGSATFPGGLDGVTVTTGPDGSATTPSLQAGATGGPVTLTVDAADVPEATIQLTVTAPATVTGTPPNATAGQAYRYSFVTTGYPAPVVTLAAGTLPRGLTLAPDGTISGTATRAGSYAFAVTAANSTHSTTLVTKIKVMPQAPASVTALTGSGQTALTGARFGVPLSAVVTDRYINLEPGISVTFRITAGSATFAGGAKTVTVTTNTLGVAIAPALTAGSTAGAVTVTASAAGASSTATFHLTVKRR
jgi:hypothetical protein